ncbi:hypothetical protein [Stakelama tenebrarum]|uniref:Uncharacterized protein n=1 Tax=Stakelama tenebrarum TaxID=2711215 RepID=A0A6G6Y4K3_9SPHN|nr:hypothetical protein [Sphingosinithalassobacter tenebrarum]QIG79737.1 hypothetical protein G5C33_07965 [Sphingosinithalassobacter tenebrarum]
MELWPDSEPATRRESLAGRVGVWLRARWAALRPASSATAGAGARGATTALLLFAIGPVLFLCSTLLLTAWIDARNAALRKQLAPRIAAERQERAIRHAVQRLTSNASPGTVIEAVAKGLPDDAFVAGMERSPDGIVFIRIEGPDPERTIAALHDEPMLAGLRATDQRPGHRGMVVFVAGRPE